jgi:NitT/TauT family transport system substrate-binding protein
MDCSFTRHSRAAAFVALLTLTALFSVSCGSAPKSEQPKAPLRLSINSWVGWGPLFIAKEKGLFGDTKLDIIFTEDAGARRSSMVSGQVDSYASSVDNLAIDATFGVTGKTVLCFDESYGADGIVAKRGIAFSNLKGRKVAVQKGLPGHFLLLSALQRNGLKPNDVSILDMDADKAGSAFVGGSVDVAVTWEPWISKAMTVPGTQKLFTTRENPGLIVDTLVVRDSILKDRPQDVRSIIKGWFAALQWYEANSDEGNKIIAAAYRLKPEEVKDIASGIRFCNSQRNRELLGTPSQPGTAVALFTQAAGLWKDAGVTNTVAEAKSYFDSSYLPQQ